MSTELKKALHKIAKVLLLYNICSVTYKFNGSGNGGFLEEVGRSYFSEKEPVKDIPEMVLSELFYDLLEIDYSGWQDNLGSMGTIYVSATSKDINAYGAKLNFLKRFEDYDETTNFITLDQKPQTTKLEFLISKLEDLIENEYACTVADVKAEIRSILFDSLLCKE